MRNGEGGTVPSYNVQLVTDTTHGLIVNVEATTDAIDYRQMEPALNRCLETLGCRPQQIVADGDYTNHASVQAAATCGVDFYAPGRRAGNRVSATHKDVVRHFRPVLSPTMPSWIALLAPSDKRWVTMPF
jgi:hypothetical protein